MYLFSGWYILNLKSWTNYYLLQGANCIDEVRSNAYLNSTFLLKKKLLRGLRRPPVVTQPPMLLLRSPQCRRLDVSEQPARGVPDWKHRSRASTHCPESHLYWPAPHSAESGQNTHCKKSSKKVPDLLVNNYSKLISFLKKNETSIGSFLLRDENSLPNHPIKEN